MQADQPSSSPSSPRETPAPAAEQERVPLGALGLAIIAAAIAVRVALFASGRIPIDGDESLMGIMGFHIAGLERFPLYFYGQYYLGTLELPPLALLMALGPEAWHTSAWTIRIIAWLYLVLLLVLHYRLCERFFGRRAALWCIFALALGHAYWMDYSSRLRHVTLMLALGEAMALLAIGILERWRTEKRVSLARTFALGLVGGLAWWHYQLVIVFFVPIAVGVAFSPFARAWITRPGLRGGVRPEPDATAQGIFSRIDYPALIRLAVMMAVVLVIIGISIGEGASWWRSYRYVFLACLSAFGAAFALACRAWVIERSGAGQLDDEGAAARLAPAMLAGGFILGSLPMIVAFSNMTQAFWIAEPQQDWTTFFTRARELFVLDISVMTEMVRLSPGDRSAYILTPATTANLVLYAAGSYALIRRLWRPASRLDRAGAALFCLMLATLIATHLNMPPKTVIAEPRFLVPLYVTASVALGLLAADVQSLIAQLTAARAPWAPSVFAAFGVAAVIALRVPLWQAMPSRETDLRSGHRTDLLKIVRTLGERDVDRVVMEIGSEWTRLGCQLEFASGLKLRCNYGALDERLGAIVDERQWPGATYRLSEESYLESPRRRPPPLAVQAGEARALFEKRLIEESEFRAGEYYLYLEPRRRPARAR